LATTFLVAPFFGATRFFDATRRAAGLAPRFAPLLALAAAGFRAAVFFREGLRAAFLGAAFLAVFAAFFVRRTALRFAIGGLLLTLTVSR
jgi:hypothetical protein